MKLILTEIKSVISTRRHLIREGRRHVSEYDEESTKFSTLSMIANLKVLFYKLDLGAQLGKKNQTTERTKPLPLQNNSNNEDETVVDAYFHSSPVRLLSGNLVEEVHFIVDNFSMQVDEYTTLKSGMKLFNVSQCELSFYDYKSMVGGSDREEIPEHVHMTLYALYSHGKLLHISYDNINAYIMKNGETSNVYTDNCFAHVLAACYYLKEGYSSEDIPVNVDASTGYVLDKYTQLNVKDIMCVEKVRQHLKNFDFSMCENNGRPMLLEDVGKFYKQNYEKNCNVMPIINVFKLDYVDGANDVLLPLVDALDQKKKEKYVITQYFLARDFDDEADDDRDVINILYWVETEHYYLITNLKTLVLSVNFNNSFKVYHYQKLCYVCLNMVDVRCTEMALHVKLCRSRNEKQHIRYPLPGKNIEKFRNYRLMNKLRFYVAADSECSLLPIREPDLSFLNDDYGNDVLSQRINQSIYENIYQTQNFPPKGCGANSKPVHIHRLNSLGWKLYVDEEIALFPHEMFNEEFGKYVQIIMANDDSEAEEERLVDEFIKWLNSATEFIRRWLEKINEKTFQANILSDLKLKPETQKIMESSSHCIYCGEEFKEPPVVDHCHLTFQVRGAACSECNLNAPVDSWRSFRLQVYFHNFSKYDSCFIAKYLKKPTLSGGGKKSYWNCRMRGNKIHQIKTDLLDFRDSLDLFPLSIASLSKNLPVNHMIHVNQVKWKNEDTSKNIYPYEFINSVNRFNDAMFPSIKKFESSLTGKVSEKDYTYSKKLYEDNCVNFCDWHKHYLALDVCILIDALVYWQGVIFKEFGVDLLRCHSLPSCAKQSMLKMSRISLELLTDSTMHNLFQNNIRGGLCISAFRSHIVQDQTLESIRYFDVKSLYASVQKLYRHPVGGFHFLSPVPSPEILTTMAMEYVEKEAEVGYLCVVDLIIPRKLHWMLSDFPVTYQKTTVDPCLYPPSSKWHHLPKSKTCKLIPSLFDPKDYGVSMLTLSFLVRLGLQIEKVHHVVAYNQEYFLRDFVDICLKKRKESGLKMDDVTFKLIVNGMFGKFIENAFLYTDTKFVFNKTDYDRILKDATRFVNAKWEKYGVFMQKKLSTVKMDKPIAVGWSILCKSKAHFQEMYYFKILPAYIKVVRPLTVQNRLRVMYVDTDSLILYLCLDIEREMKFYSLLSDIFDFSTLPRNDRFYSTVNKSVVGIFKDEVSGLLIRSQHSNGAKSYLYTIENNTGLDKRFMTEKEKEIYYPRIKLKALSRYFQSVLLQEEDFMDVFRNPNKERCLTYSALRIGHGRKMYTYTCKKKVLDSHDSKRWVYPSQTDSLALGHYLTLDSEWVERVMKRQ